MTMREIHAMTNLLDDPDVNIYTQIERELVSIGYEILPQLENIWTNTSDHLVQTRIETIIDRINFNEILDEYHIWKSLDNPDLIDAMAILNKLQYPLIDCLPYYQQIEEKTKEIWLEFNENLTSFELVNVLNRIIYEFWGFRSVHDADEKALHHQFLSNLMENQCGNQYSIACLYLILTEKLKLPIYPVLIRDQVILAYVNTDKIPGEVNVNDILFYINPNEQGVIFDEHSIKRWMIKSEVEFDEKAFLPIDHKQLVEAYIKRLMVGYEQTNHQRKVDFLRTLLK